MANRDKILEDIKTNQFDFYKSSDEIKELVLNDLEICLEFFKNDWRVISWNFEKLSDDIRNNKDFVLKFMKCNGINLQYVSDKLKRDIDVCLISALSTEGRSLKYADKSLFNDLLFLELAFKAIKGGIDQDAYSIIYSSSNLFRYSKFKLDIIFNYPKSFKFLCWLIALSTLIFGYSWFSVLLSRLNANVEGNDVILSYFAFIVCIGFVVPLIIGYLLNFITFNLIPKFVIGRRIKNEIREKGYF